MIPIRSKQSWSPDSVDRENTGDEFHADVIPDVKRKKNKRNITQEFQTSSKMSYTVNTPKYGDNERVGISNFKFAFDDLKCRHRKNGK